MLWCCRVVDLCRHQDRMFKNDKTNCTHSQIQFPFPMCRFAISSAVPTKLKGEQMPLTNSSKFWEHVVFSAGFFLFSVEFVQCVHRSTEKRMTRRLQRHPKPFHVQCNRTVCAAIAETVFICAIFVLHRSQNAKWKIICFVSFTISKWTLDSSDCRIFGATPPKWDALSTTSSEFRCCFLCPWNSEHPHWVPLSETVCADFLSFGFFLSSSLFCSQQTQTDSIETLAKITVIARVLELCLRFSFQNALNRNLCASMYREKERERQITVPYAERAQISLDMVFVCIDNRNEINSHCLVSCRRRLCHCIMSNDRNDPAIRMQKFRNRSRRETNC